MISLLINSLPPKLPWPLLPGLAKRLKKKKNPIAFPHPLPPTHSTLILPPPYPCSNALPAAWGRGGCGRRRRGCLWGQTAGTAGSPWRRGCTWRQSPTPTCRRTKPGVESRRMRSVKGKRGGGEREGETIGTRRERDDGGKWNGEETGEAETQWETDFTWREKDEGGKSGETEDDMAIRQRENEGEIETMKERRMKERGEKII